VVMLAPRLFTRRSAALWNSSGATPNRSRVPPTSFSATNPFQS
jgi:hypothetical protein